MKNWGKRSIQFTKKQKTPKLDDLSWLSILLFVTLHENCEIFRETLRILSDTPSQHVELTNHILSSELKLRGHSVQTAYLWFAKKHGSFWEAAYRRGISPVMRPTPPWARRGEQHMAGTQRWLEVISAPRSDIMLRSAKLQWCYWSPVARHIIRQHIST